MVTATIPLSYAIDPHTTKVPTEKKLINNESPEIHQGTAPPAAKNEDTEPSFLPKERPRKTTSTAKPIAIETSNVDTMVQPIFSVRKSEHSQRLLALAAYYHLLLWSCQERYPVQ